MMIPKESDPGWVKVISAKVARVFEFMPTKILMGRLNLLYQRDPSPPTTKKSVSELRAFFEKNKNAPKAQADLKKIFG